MIRRQLMIYAAIRAEYFGAVATFRVAWIVVIVVAIQRDLLLTFTLLTFSNLIHFHFSLLFSSILLYILFYSNYLFQFIIIVVIIIIIIIIIITR